MSTPQQTLSNDNITATADIRPTPETEPEFILYDDFADTSQQIDFFIPNRFIVAYCQQGTLSATINHQQTTTLSHGDLMIVLPRTSLEDFNYSDDLQMLVLSLSPSVINDSLLADKNLWPTIEFVANHPKTHLTDDEKEVGQQYYQLYKSYSKRKPAKFQRNILHTLHKSIIYEIADMLLNRMDTIPENEQYTSPRNTSHTSSRIKRGTPPSNSSTKLWHKRSDANSATHQRLSKKSPTTWDSQV